MKLIKQITVIATLVLSCFLICNSQQNQTKSKPKPKPDFSGTWVFTPKEDKVTKVFPAYMIPRNTASCLKEIRLKVEHQEPQIKFSYTFVFNNAEKTNEEIYYSDNRSEKNQDFVYVCEKGKITLNISDNPIETDTCWKGNSLITRTREKYNFQKGLETITEVKLAKDGQTLIIIMRVTNDPRRDGKNIRLYESFVVERKFHRVQETK